ncbi:39S ribosomal protein L37, mitochondrial isoform X2 [Anopheles moucheti]|uniref:39S ribosomal protein L37, mitochondrial isoform X2 n=1 Tax=Anopheles moucheti TaxID=186751 RepID=UPI0022F0D091|nr:39S ribosomal protein L37, mitochondrial isoform X2 [Anopheles moucheti]
MHIGFHFKKHWLQQGKRVPLSTGAEEELAARGIVVVEPKEVLKEQRPRVNFHVPGIVPPPVAFDEMHSVREYKPAYVYGDTNVLLEGVRQAQSLLNTVVFDDLPLKMKEKLEQTIITSRVDRSMQQAVLLYDAEQSKRVYVKVPDRPAYNLPREYGLSEGRKNQLILAKLVTHCERYAGFSVNANRKVVYDARFLVPVVKGNERILFDTTAESMIISHVPLKPLDTATYRPMDLELPNLFPLKETVSIPVQNSCDWRNHYPISSNCKLSHPHTVLLHCSPSDVKNATELPVTRDQTEGRTMVKAFAVAAARARQVYGENVKSLPKPITVQAVQTDSKTFHFSVYQLNTLDLNSSTVRNMWFRKAPIVLYSRCTRASGARTLVDYNKDVLRHFAAFYSN